MGNGEEDQGEGGSWMTPRFWLAQVSGREDGETRGRPGLKWGGQDHESESGYVESEEPLRHPPGGIKWAGSGTCRWEEA